MSEAYIGEVRSFAGSNVPNNWLPCDGRILAISTKSHPAPTPYNTLFSIIGSRFGGDGINNFALPDLRQRAALHVGSSTGPGLSPHTLGEKAGDAKKNVTAANLPAHTHAFIAANANGDSPIPSEQTVFGKAYKSTGPVPQRQKQMYGNIGPAQRAQLADAAVENTGEAVSTNNYQPYQVVNFCICYNGIYPPRN